MSAAQPSLTILEKFNQLEANFNKHALMYLYKIMGIVDSEPKDDKDQRQHDLLSEAYEYWYEKITENPKSMDLCVSLYNAVGDAHELLMKRDQQLFTLNGDFLTNIFQVPGKKMGKIDTVYIYDQLSDGLDEESAEQPEDERDAKDNFWSMTIGLYRLSAMICIYLKMPIVREIIDMIIVDSPELNQTNMFQTIFSKFKGSKRLRKLIMKLMKSKEDNFGEIFTSLQKVIATFNSEVNVDTNMQANLETIRKKMRESFETVLRKANVKGLTQEQASQLAVALEEKNESALNDLVEESIVTKEQLARVQSLYVEQGLDKMPMNKVVKDLGQTMTDMMAAIESNDEKAVETILSRAGAGLNLPSEEIARMQTEMEVLEQEDQEEDEQDQQKEEKEEKEEKEHRLEQLD